MSSAEQRIRDFYGFAFPDDFFRFCEFTGRLPHRLLEGACDLRPAFPFDVAEGRPASNHPDHPRWEDRYYHDLPEFITLFLGSVDGLHHGYYFDSPGELPPIVAHYWHSDTFEHAVDGDTIFEATRRIVEQFEVDSREMMDEEPGEAEFYEERLEQLAVIRATLADFWGKDREQTGEKYLDDFGAGGWRKPVARTWDRLGIMVPPEKYRKLGSDPWSRPPVNLKRSQVEGMVGETLRELREGRPGAALKLGHDLWVWAIDYPECYSLLDAAYAALGREPLRRLLSEATSWREHCDGRGKPGPA